MDKIKLFDPGKEWNEIKEFTLPKVENFFSSGNYIYSPVVDEFEKTIGDFYNTYCISTNSGQSAIYLLFSALKQTKHLSVYINPNTYIACAIPIRELEININLIDVTPDNLEEMNVEMICINDSKDHNCPIFYCTFLYGFSYDSLIPKLRKLSSSVGGIIVFDLSQYHGVYFELKNNEYAVFSCQATKQFSACGEAGFILSNDVELNNKIQILKRRGLRDRDNLEYLGGNYRTDAIQLLILLEKFKFLQTWKNKRLDNANLYSELLNGVSSKKEFHNPYIYPYYSINRSHLMDYLNSFGIETAIHYPNLIQDHKPFSDLSKFNTPYARQQTNLIFSLPVHQYITESQICFIAEKINEFERSSFPHPVLS